VANEVEPGICSNVEAMSERIADRRSGCGVKNLGEWKTRVSAAAPL
jgi:hypothetical protein